MSKLVSDQADGLRRLMTPTLTRIVAVVGMLPQMGATTAAMNLAEALTNQGKDVLLLDEHCQTPESTCAVWSIDPSGNWDDVVARRLPLHRACAVAKCGVKVILAPLSLTDGRADLRLKCQENVILIDASLGSSGELSLLAQQADDCVLVLQTYPSSITAAYSGIKQLHHAHALNQFRLLINGVASADAARKVTANLANTCSRYLSVSVQSAGWVRSDPHVAGARRSNKTVLEAYPASAASVDFRRIASEVEQWPWCPSEKHPSVRVLPDNDADRSRSAIARTPARTAQAAV